MDPWSKVDYSWHIREPSMEMEGLLEVNPPSGRVLGQRLLAAPILKRRRRYREEIGKKTSILGISFAGAKYRPKEGVRGGHQGAKRPLARPHPWPRYQGASGPGGSLLPYLGDSRRFFCVDFLYNDLLGILSMGKT